MYKTVWCIYIKCTVQVWVSNLMLLSHIQTVRLILVQIIYLKHCKYLGGDGGQCFDFFFFSVCCEKYASRIPGGNIETQLLFGSGIMKFKWFIRGVHLCSKDPYWKTCLESLLAMQTQRENSSRRFVFVFWQGPLWNQLLWGLGSNFLGPAAKVVWKVT